MYMRIGFLTNKITIRGTETNLYNYADYNEKILHNESIIITRPYDYIMNVSPRDVQKSVYTHFSNRFPMVYYYNPSDIKEIVKHNNIDILFIEKAGSKSDGLVFDYCKSIIHAVFITDDPHGDLYAPISDAVNRIHKTNYPVLPNIVNIFDTNDTLRKELNIPADAIVFGSYSGADEYTVDYVKQAVCDVISNEAYKHIYFIYLNIDRFGPDSDRLQFLPGTPDLEYKRKFINTCDAMLYGRKGGETFGISCGEFSVAGKPVIGRTGEEGYAHEEYLGDNMIKHTSYNEVLHIITHWDVYKRPVINSGYENFTPVKVMKLFKGHLDRIFNSTMDYNKNSIIFCTAFKDIGRKNWSNVPRTNDEYLQCFLQLARNIMYKLVVYLDQPMYDRLKKFYLRPNIELRLLSDVKTFYDEYLENETRMMSSEEYKHKIPLDRKDVVEHVYPEYTLINHSKINCIKHTQGLYKDYEYYGWIDFGCIRNKTEDVPKFIDFSKLQTKITYLMLKEPPKEYIPAEKLLTLHDVFIPGGQFIVHTSLVDWFEDKYRELLENWKRDIICDDDQAALYQIWFQNKDMFVMFKNHEWVSLFRTFLNSNVSLKSSNDIHKIINISKLDTTYVELGVGGGTFSEYILKNTAFNKAILIDPYTTFNVTDYYDSMNFIDMNENYRECQRRLAPYGKRVTFIRKTSAEAVADFADDSIDVVYIDGNHEYKYVIEDIRNYWSKLRKGGYMFGDAIHEFSHESKDTVKIWDGLPIEESKSFGKYGVHAAVIDFCKEKRLSYQIFGHQFMIYKH